MATREQIFEIRLRISDPPGFISFLEIALLESLPAVPANQTCYYVDETLNYYSTEKTSGALPANYTVEALRVSDTRLSNWIDLYGLDGATCQAIKAIISQIGQELQIKKNATGADSVEYQALADTIAFYKDLLSLCSEQKKSNANNNSGKMGGSAAPVIAGGDL